MNKILFRGFHPDNNGATTITLNDEKIKGEWVYGLLSFRNEIRVFTTHKWYDEGEEREYATTEDLRVLPETVGQWVTTDKNGKDVFEGDIVKRNAKKQNHTDTLYRVKYNSRQMLFDFVSTNKPCSTNGFCLSEIEFELIGNIWEVEE